MKRLPYSFLYVLVLVSGGLASAYETLWFRFLSLVLGSTSLALTLILTSFMLGLGLGSLFWGRLADRVRPLRLYQILECGIGVFAILSYFLLSPVNTLYHGLYQGLEGHPALLTLARFMISMAFLVLPTLFMGGTMPVAIRYLIHGHEAKSREIATFYWINTLGAAVSAILLPIYLLIHVRIPILLFIFAGMNILLALAAFLLPDRNQPSGSEPKAPSAPAAIAILPMASFFLSGLASLAIETLWNRHLVLVFGGSVYTFGVILFVYLLGVALGSWIYGRLSPIEEQARGIYSVALLTAAAYGGAVLWIMPHLGVLQLKLLDALGLTFGHYHAANLILLGVCVFPVTIGFGIAFPAAIHALTPKIEGIGRSSGLLIAINSLGTAAGPIVLTFLVLPYISFQGSYVLVFSLLILAALGMHSRSGQGVPWKTLAAGAAVLGILILQPRWDNIHFLLGTPKNPQFALESFQKMKQKINLSTLKVLYDRNDYEVNTAVLLNPNNVRSMVINGKADASDGLDMITQSLSGHIPFLTGRPIKDVLVVGLGSGVTTHAVLTHPVRSVASVEISASVIEAARLHFAHVNYLCFEDPRSTLVDSDGRNYLAHADKTYDLIISEPSNPWLAGVSSLFTREFFQVVRSRLNSEGLLCQWLNLYNLSFDHVLNIFSTLKQEFPHVATFYNPETNDLLFFASIDPLVFGVHDPALIAPDARAQLASIGLSSPDQIYQRFMWSSEDLRAFTPTLPDNSDQLPWLEFLAPKDVFFTNIQGNVLEMLQAAPASSLAMPVTVRETPAGLLIPPQAIIRPGAGAGRVRAMQVVSRTFKPFGSTQSYLRFAGYQTTFDDGFLFSQRVGSASDPAMLSFYAHQFTADLLGQEREAAFNGHPAYAVLAERGMKLILVWHCPASGKIHVWLGTPPATEGDLASVLSQVRFICHEGERP